MKNILSNHTSALKLKDRLAAAVFFTRKMDVENKSTLNVGCGFGWFERVLAKNGAKRIEGIDVSQESITIAKKELSVSNIHFQVSGATDLPYEDNTFDTIFCWEVIEHIPKHTEARMFSEFCRVLKESGVVYLSTPHNRFWSKVLDPAWWLIGHRHYSLEELHTLYCKHFKLKKYQIKGGWWFTFSLLNMYVSKWIFRREMFFKDFFQKMTDKEYQPNYSGWANIFILLQKR